MVEQLAEWHGYTDPLPLEGEENALGAAYHKLLDLPLTPPRALVLDGLDEVSWDLKPYLSRPLPDGLHLILTVRDVGQKWASQYGLRAGQYQHEKLDGLSREGVAEVLLQAGGVAAAIADEPNLFDKVMDKAAYQTDPKLGADPFYVRILAEDAAEKTLTSDNRVRIEKDGVTEFQDLDTYLDSQPRGLSDYLDAWYEEVTQAAGEAPARDLFATLAVALGPIGRTDLQRLHTSLVAKWPSNPFDAILKKVRRLVAEDKEGNYAFAHPRLTQYMRARIKQEDPSLLQQYTDALLTDCARWKEHQGLYALRYAAQHLAALVKRSEPLQRAATIDRLVRLVVDQEFQEVHEKKVKDPAALQRDLEQALRFAAGEDGVPVSLVVQAALALVSFRHQKLVPEQVFALARAGKLEEAERRMGLFALQLDTNWYWVLLLAIAWLGFDQNPEEARVLRARVASQLAPVPELDLLRARIAATMDQEPVPVLPLDPAPPSHIAGAMVMRLAGQGMDGSLDGRADNSPGPN